jgi:hypothetical protein
MSAKRYFGTPWRRSATPLAIRFRLLLAVHRAAATFTTTSGQIRKAQGLPPLAAATALTAAATTTLTAAATGNARLFRFSEWICISQNFNDRRARAVHSD